MRFFIVEHGYATEIKGISREDFEILQRNKDLLPGTEFASLSREPVHESEFFASIRKRPSFMLRLKRFAENNDAAIYSNDYDGIELVTQKKNDCLKILQLLNKYNISNLTPLTAIEEGKV